MSIWNAPMLPIDWQPGGGEATLGEIMSSMFESNRLAHSATEQSEAIETAFDNRIDAIKQATGVALENPYRAALPPGVFSGETAPVGDTADIFLKKVEPGWTEQLNKLAEKYPDATDVIAPGRAITDDAYSLMQSSEAQSAANMASRSGILKYGAAFIGGFGAALRDPVQSSLTILGGGAGAARTVGGRIVEEAIKGAAINAVTEAAVQPFVQQGRAKAGLPSGFGEALSDIGSSAVFGAAFGGGMHAVGEAARFILSGRSAPDALRSVPEPEPVKPPPTAGETLGESLPPVQTDPELFPAEVRGAAQAVQADEAITSVKPIEVDAEAHDVAASSAIAAAEDPARIPELLASTGRGADVVNLEPLQARVKAMGSPLDVVDAWRQDPEGTIAAIDGIVHDIKATDRAIAKRHGVRLDDIEDAPLTDAERHQLFYDGSMNIEDWRDVQRQLGGVHDLDEATAEISRELGRLPETNNFDEMEWGQKMAAVRLQVLFGEVQRLGGDLNTVVKDAGGRYGSRFEDPEDAIFMAQGAADRLRSVFGQSEPAGVARALPEPDRLPEAGRAREARTPPAAVDREDEQVHDILAQVEDRSPPAEPGPEAIAQADAILAAIEDPAAVTIADGVSLKSVLDDVKRQDGMANFVQGCRML